MNSVHYTLVTSAKKLYWPSGRYLNLRSEGRGLKYRSFTNGLDGKMAKEEYIFTMAKENLRGGNRGSIISTRMDHVILVDKDNYAERMV